MARIGKPSGPDSFSNKYTNPYSKSELVFHSSSDHVFVNKDIRGLKITGTGNVVYKLAGDDHYLTLPVYVPSGGNTEIRGECITEVRSTANGTTATVYCGMI